MPFSTTLYIYNVLQKKFQQHFNSKNHILSPPEIHGLLKSSKKERAKTLRIFHSAVVTHAPVDGVPYYLNSPVSNMFYHDGFKRAAIADGITTHGLVQTAADMKLADEILRRLNEPDKNSGYVQILAWHSLGSLALDFPDQILLERDKILRAAGGSSASLLGTVRFLDSLLRTKKKKPALMLLSQAEERVKYRCQFAWLQYYMSCNPALENPLKKSPPLPEDVRTFIIRSRKPHLFSESDFHQGCREIGLLPWERAPEFWPGTPHAQIAERLAELRGTDIKVLGAYSCSIH